MTNLPTSLEVDASITQNGIDVIVNGENFPIRFPEEIWAKYPEELKEILRDNLTHSTTLFLPQMLNLSSITYRTSRPLSETFFYENGIYDMPICAYTDKCSSMDYIKKFFNSIHHFADNKIKTPSVVDFVKRKNKKPVAIIPFSFGKESMLSFSLCKELGIEPIPINFIEFVNNFEHMHKTKLIEEFEKKFKIKIPTIEYGPSMLRYGRHWGLNTELGWGLHTTEFALLCLPFVHYYNADYIILGNEYSCDVSYYDKEGVLTYECGYDQHYDWTAQQTLLATLMLGRKVHVSSFVEPLHEIGVFSILHHRYPAYGKFQMSCMADNPHAQKNRWCQTCSKCALNFTFSRAVGIDPEKFGFTENLFDRDDMALFEGIFEYYSSGSHEYQPNEEVGLALDLAFKNNSKGKVMDRFREVLLSTYKPARSQFMKEYLGLHSSSSIPEEFKEKILNIYREELKKIEARL